MTRRLVDVSQDVIVREEDCGTDRFIISRDLKDGNEVIEEMKNRIVGRTSFEDVLNLKSGEIIVHRNEIITEDMAEMIAEAGISELKVRSVLGCKASHGVCAKCYGRNLAT